MNIHFTVEETYRLARKTKHIKWYALGFFLERFDVLVRIIVDEAKKHNKSS